ncbi:MAG: XTP/dITP diphosphatase [Saccharofermentanales bacterium]
MDFIAATKNKDKINEIKEILKDFPLNVISMADAGYFDEIEENGSTFEENALIKARAIHKMTGGYVMADDSGLSITALNGAPGIFSSRFAGETAGYKEKIQHIWDMLDEVKATDRSAKFICAIAVIRPDGSEFTVRGECDGIIHDKISGKNGFGYDPVFYMPEYGMTTAQMTPAMKHSISHRGKALRKMVEILCKEL